MLIDSIKQISKHQYLLIMRLIHLLKTVNNKEEKEFYSKLLYQTIFLGEKKALYIDIQKRIVLVLLLNFFIEDITE